MPKKKIYKLRIDHLRYPDKGIAFLADEEHQEIAVKHGLPGQLVEAECSRKRKQWHGRILQLLEKAPEEIQVSCPDFGECGGCSFLNIPYEYELELKREMVARLLQMSIPSIVPAPNSKLLPYPAKYRNKMEFSFGDCGKDGGLALGIRKRNRYYELAVPKDCVLIPEDFREILLATLNYFSKSGETFYHRMRRSGTLRYLVLRRGEFTGELLINLVTTEGLDKSHLSQWLSKLLALSLEGNIVGILHTVSNALSDAVVPEDVSILWGRDSFNEKILGLTFEISPFSFFQTFSGAAELLYNTVAEFAGQAERIYDLYCGTGTIAQLLAPYASEVLGIELVPEAVKAAIKNARANGISNCRFIAGDVLKVLDEHNFKVPDVLVLDPPRDGIHPKALSKLINLAAAKVIYVSCKPTSLARDLAAFTAGGYSVSKLRLHDMFPRTPHVETVVLLCR